MISVGLMSKFRLSHALNIAIASIGKTFAATQAQSAELSLSMPLECKLGTECFLQQMADLDTSDKIVDPFCGSASYDGHKGTDIRLLSMKDISDNYRVLAAADGVIKAYRDGEPDRLVRTDSDRDQVRNKECGNGVVIDHGKGIETQYCHMKQGSITIASGQAVKAGDSIGSVGASGLAQFPHLHFSVRKNGKDIDPFTGRQIGEECTGDISQTWWQDKNLAKGEADALILKTGLSGVHVEHDQLIIDGGPMLASPVDSAVIGWVWLVNLKKDDRIYMKLTGPGSLTIENTTEPLNRNKASWSSYIGKKRNPEKGEYDFEVKVLRKMDVVRSRNSTFTIE